MLNNDLSKKIYIDSSSTKNRTKQAARMVINGRKLHSEAQCGSVSGDPLLQINWQALWTPVSYILIWSPLSVKLLMFIGKSVKLYFIKPKISEYLRMTVFWVAAPCNLEEVYQHFRVACCLNHQGPAEKTCMKLTVKSFTKICQHIQILVKIRQQ
jgi:hypothetical protein